MEKIAFFNTTSQKARWMTVCLAILTVLTLYEEILYGYLLNNHDGVLAIALYRLSTTSSFPILLNLANLACICYMYDALRRSAKHTSTKINVLCWILILSKVIYAISCFLYQFLYLDSLGSANGVYSSYLFTAVRGIFAFTCLFAIIMLSVCLIRNYTGRIKTLGIFWLVTLLFPYVIESVLLFVANIPDSIAKDYWMMKLITVCPYFNFICKVIPLILIYRCFKNLQN